MVVPGIHDHFYGGPIVQFRLNRYVNNSATYFGHAFALFRHIFSHLHVNGTPSEAIGTY
jgi:hypothetical protein